MFFKKKTEEFFS